MLSARKQRASGHVPVGAERSAPDHAPGSKASSPADMLAAAVALWRKQQTADARPRNDEFVSMYTKKTKKTRKAAVVHPPVAHKGRARGSRRGRMEIVYVYQRLRKDFGRAPKFTEMPCDTLFDIMPNPEMLG
jgi:hypothetical protein